MEHRQSKRVPANAQLRVYRRGKPVGNGRLRDVSRDGLYIVTDFDEISVNQKLEIEFAPAEQPEATEKRMSAVVVYKDDQGLGLELEDEDQPRGLAELYSWLRRRLRNEQASKAKPVNDRSTKTRHASNY